MIDDSCTDVNKLKEERQRLLGLTHTLKIDNDDLRRQIKGHERANRQKVAEIRASALHIHITSEQNLYFMYRLYDFFFFLHLNYIFALKKFLEIWLLKLHLDFLKRYQKTFGKPLLLFLFLVSHRNVFNQIPVWKTEYI